MHGHEQQADMPAVLVDQPPYTVTACLVSGQHNLYSAHRRYRLLIVYLGRLHSGSCNCNQLAYTAGYTCIEVHMKGSCTCP